LRQVLFARPRRSGGEFADQFPERFDSCQETLCVERKGSFLFADIENPLLENRSGVDFFFDEMPGHAMRGLAVDQRPGCGVDSGVSRQRSIVKVHGAADLQPKEFSRNQAQIGDAEQMIMRALAKSGRHVRWIDERDAMLLRPIAKFQISRDQSTDLMAGIEDRTNALACQRIVPDDEAP
jgi:hypothetical protein